VGFGLLHQFTPKFLSLTRYFQLFTFNFLKSFSTSPFHLFFGRALDLIPMGFRSVTLLSIFLGLLALLN
jgi:hypothetical protein